MAFVPPALEQLIALLHRLPGVGEKTAQRLAFFILDEHDDYALTLAKSLQDVVARVHFCPICFNIAEGERCPICADNSRDRGLVCVVESVHDLMALERAGVHRGTYHVLHGSLSPLRGVGPDELRIAPLIERSREGTLREVILATNVDVEGEATAVYLSRLLKPLVERVSRIATGIPMGSDLEYMDGVTLARAFDGRRAIG